MCHAFITSSPRTPSPQPRRQKLDRFSRTGDFARSNFSCKLANDVKMPDVRRLLALDVDVDVAWCTCGMSVGALALALAPAAGASVGGVWRATVGGGITSNVVESCESMLGRTWCFDETV